MKKLLPILLISGLCASTVATHAWHDGWAPFAVGSVMGLGIGAVAASAHDHHCHVHSTIIIDDLEEQNALLHEKVAALRAKVHNLEQQNQDLEEENAVLRHKIKKMERSGSKLVVAVDAD